MPSLKLHANGHLQAKGKDTTGSEQYFYHEDWQALRDTLKFERIAEVGAALPSIRRKVRKLLKSDAGSKERALAACVRVLDGTGLRVGNRASASEGTFGVSTLTRRHLQHEGKHLVLNFTGKAGVKIKRQVSAHLCELLSELENAGTAPLFEYRCGEGQWSSVCASQVNEFLSELHSVDMTAKEFRTFRASALFVKYWSQKGGASASLKSILEKVSKKLGNTPQTLRTSYVHPELIQMKKNGLKIRGMDTQKIRGLKKHERLMLKLIDA